MSDDSDRISDEENHEEWDLFCERVQRAAEDLGGQCDAIQIFVTRSFPKPTGTVGYSTGCGNWYSRIGVVRDWWISQKEDTKLKAKRMLEEEDSE